MRKTIFLVSSFISGMYFSQQIFPTPQEVKTIAEVDFKGIKSAHPLLKSFVTEKGISIKEKSDKKLKPEEYRLSVQAKKIIITYASERGRFYAYQSLKQILKQAKQSEQLPLTEIVDFPDLAHRGSVEGFYGDPWTMEDRISQLQFYGDWKLNTYIYGPKDDPYHSAPKWREPYPDAEASQIKTLVETANSNFVDFYWAIHPGQDIQWNDEDRNNVVNKFEKMYQLGVRNFAVFFDDISGEGTKAEKQAGLMNYLQTEFADKKKDVGPLIICPTDYNKSWANPKEDGYLGTLGKVLDKRVHIMWTGDHVLADITETGQKWVNNLIKRPAFVWWNFPVSDYTRNHLLLGPVYGLDQNAKKEMSGFVSNPMDKSEASKVALFSVADYTWNTKAYQPDYSWNAAIEALHPEISEAYKTFSAHNADPGPNFSDYRREESVMISKILENEINALNQWKINKLSEKDYAALKTEISKFEPAAERIGFASKNEKLKQELKPWLAYFKAEGQAALALLEMNHASSDAQLYQEFQKLDQAHEKMKFINQNENRNPYQPGIVTGSRYILPWIEQSYLHYHQLLKSKGFGVKEISQPNGKVYTNIKSLGVLPVQNVITMGNRAFPTLKLNAVNEFISFKPQDYFGIEFTAPTSLREVKFKATEKIEGLEIQYSKDGINWQKEKLKDAKFVRIINQTLEIKQVKPQLFEVVFE